MKPGLNRLESFINLTWPISTGPPSSSSPTSKPTSSITDCSAVSILLTSKKSHIHSGAAQTAAPTQPSSSPNCSSAALPHTSGAGAASATSTDDEYEDPHPFIYAAD